MPGAAASFYGGGDGLTVLKKVWSKLREGYLKEMLQELGWIDQYARRYRGQILLYMVLGLAAASLGLGGSLLSRELTSAVVEARGPWRDVLLLAGLYILLGLASIGLGAVNSRISARINLKIQNEMQADLFRRFLRAEWQALLNYHSGDLLNRLTSDVSTVAASVFSLLPSLVIRLFQFAACLALILRYDPVMAGLALLSAPVTQPSAQAPHWMHLDDFFVSGLTVGICHGHAWVQAPQPTHFSVSTLRTPFSSA